MPRTTKSARFTSRFAVAAGAALVLTVAPASVATAAPNTSCVNASVLAVQNRVVTDTNAARKKLGKAPLIASGNIRAVATAWSEKQANAGRMSHNPSYAKQIPSGWSAAAENVAYGYSPQRVTRAWLDSPGHRANIMGGYTHVGVGVACSASGTPYYTQVFAKY